MFNNLKFRLPRSLRLLAMTKTGILARRPVLILLEILAVFLLTIFADRALGIYFEKTLHFKVYAPNMTLHYETGEFKFDAVISSQGLRSEETTLSAKKGVTRILALGDSFTWGWGVNGDHSWPNVLESKLRESGKNVEVINAAVAGEDLWSESLDCENYVKPMKPDLIVLGFYSSDDLFQNFEEYVKNKEFFAQKNFFKKAVENLWPNFLKLKAPRYRVAEPTLNENREHFVSESWKKIVYEETKVKGNVLSNVSAKVAEDFQAGRINPALVAEAQMKPKYFTFILDDRFLKNALLSTHVLFGQLKKCTGDIPVTVVFIPSEELIAKHYHQFRQEVGFRVDDGLLAFDFDKHLKPIVENHGFGYISLLSDFRADGCLDCYYPYDSHMTEVGYRRVAEKVYKEIFNY